MRKNVILALCACMIAMPTISAGIVDVVREQCAAGAAECCVTGVVTMVASWGERTFVAADVSDPFGPGIYVKGPSAGEVSVGDVLEMRGRPAESFRSYVIEASAVSRIGAKWLRGAPYYRLMNLRRGEFNLRRLRLKGVLQQVKGPDSLRFGTEDGVFDVHLRVPSEDWGRHVNDEFELEGVVSATYTHHGQFIGTSLFVDAPEDIHFVVASPDPLALRDDPWNPHAREMSGSVTYVDPSDWFVVQGSNDWAVVYRSPETPSPSYGDVVRVVGFAILDSGETKGELLVWKVDVLESGHPLEEVHDLRWYDIFTTAESPEQGFNGLNGCRVLLEGTLADVSAGYGGCRFGLAVRDGTVTVHASAGLGDRLGRMASGHPRLRVTGVAMISLRNGFGRGPIPEIAAFDVFVPTDEDVEVLDDSAWRRQRWTRAVLAGLFAVAALVIVLLCAKVFFDRARRLRLQAVIAERKRMSADLHDTIEQNLAIASMMMNSSLMVRDKVPDQVTSAIGSASELLAQTKREIRDVILNLRNDELFEKSPEEIFSGLAADLARGGALRVRTWLRGLPARLNGALCADLVNVVRECVANAIRHGGAKAVLIVSDARPGGFVLTVANNGSPFDPLAAPGPEQGHFGLSGMRARAKRSGFALVFGRKGRLNTVSMEVKT